MKTINLHKKFARIASPNSQILIKLEFKFSEKYFSQEFGLFLIKHEMYTNELTRRKNDLDIEFAKTRNLIIDAIRRLESHSSTRHQAKTVMSELAEHFVEEIIEADCHYQPKNSGGSQKEEVNFFTF